MEPNNVPPMGGGSVLNSASASARDLRNSTAVEQLRLTNGKLCIAEVHDVLAYAHSYVIKAPGMPQVVACLGTHTSMLPTGARECNAIHPGSLVLAYINESYLAVIVAVLPSPMGGRNLGLPDCVVPAGHAGFYVDKVHQLLLDEPASGSGMLDLSSGRPVDGVPGDWGILNEIGVGFYAGKLMAAMRSSEFCKFETYYEDQLARIAAYNFQMFTSGSELEALNDEGEWTSISGFNPYAWEATGVREPSEFPFIEPSGDAKTPRDEEFGLEPTESRQTGYWRFRTFDGYLGDIRRNYVIAPKEDGIRVYGASSNPYAGLLEERYGFDGSYTLKSAKRISLQKTVFIPVPYEKEPRDHPDGDKDFFDTSGGRDTSIQELPEPKPGEQQMSIPDVEAYASEGYNSVGVNSREKDWGTDRNLVGDATRETHPVSPSSAYRMPGADALTEEVDHRANSVRYYAARSFLELFDDGSVVIEDAHGSSITMANGNIEISAANDILLRSGRDVVSMAGNDTVLKARNDTDVSSSEGDVRVKAEKNLMVLGGNSGDKGGVLIESRADSNPDFRQSGNNANIGGLFIKSARGKISMTAKDQIYVKSFGDNGGIVLDADEGDGDVTIYGSSLRKYLKAAATEFIGAQGKATPSDQMSSLTHTAGSFNLVTGSILLGAGGMNLVNARQPSGGMSIFHKGSGAVLGGWVATGDFNQADPNSLENAAQAIVPQITALKDSVVNDYNTSVDNDFDENEDSIGNAEIFEKAGVSFRRSNETAARAEDFTIYESRWQQMFRELGSSEAWEEKEIAPYVLVSGTDSSEGPTMPYPGKEKYEAETFVRYNDRFYENGIPKERGDDYNTESAASKAADVEEVEFAGNYLVNTGTGA